METEGQGGGGGGIESVLKSLLCTLASAQNSPVKL